VGYSILGRKLRVRQLNGSSIEYSVHASQLPDVVRNAGSPTGAALVSDVDIPGLNMIYVHEEEVTVR
jgi:hypothetical protein